MGCPTCGHAMTLMDSNATLFHCQECGTVKAHTFTGKVFIYKPEIVARVATLEAENVRLMALANAVDEAFEGSEEPLSHSLWMMATEALAPKEPTT